MSALGQKQTLLLSGPPTFPQTDDHQPHCKSKKAARNQVVRNGIRAELSNENRRDADCVDPAQSWMSEPNCRCDRADGNHVTRRERGETRTAVKWIEVVNAISDQRRIILLPCLGPCAAERKFEPIFEYGSKGQTRCRRTMEV